jgi:hypothetical protein
MLICEREQAKEDENEKLLAGANTTSKEKIYLKTSECKLLLRINNTNSVSNVCQV